MLVISKKGADYSYSSVQIDFPSLASKVIKFGKDNIPNDKIHEGDGMGREDEIHVTVKYGLHTNDADEVRDVVSGFGSIDLQFGKISKFSSDDYDVIKIDITGESGTRIITDRLQELNRLISKSLECTDTFPKYIPHVTIAYVEKGSCDHLLDNDFLEGEKLTVNEVTFSPADGKDSKISLD